MQIDFVNFDFQFAAGENQKQVGRINIIAEFLSETQLIFIK